MKLNSPSKNVVFAVMAAGLAMPVAAADYRFLDGGVVDRDGSDMGVRLGGSADISYPLAVFGEVIDAGTYEQLSAGALYHTPISTGLDFNVGGSLEAVDAGTEDDTGLGVRAGLRWFVPETRGLELSPEVRHTRIFNTSITAIRAAALFPVTRQFLMQGALQGGDEDRVELGVRYNFGMADSTDGTPHY
jgi:hypothetical protein